MAREGAAAAAAADGLAATGTAAAEGLAATGAASCLAGAGWGAGAAGLGLRSLILHSTRV